MTNPKLTNRQTIEQRRAAHAWDAIGLVPQANQPKYGTLVRGFTAMIHVNGLAASAAFLLVKAGKNTNEHSLLYNHLGKWLQEQIKYSQPDLITFISKASTEDYRRATAEAIAYVIWLKRYVESKDWKSSEE